ncbi:protein phosphatase 2C domain-containing protein [Gloeocapsopsis dulcis]|uniref:Serine/threonine protein phosphatase n=1 Tax=Gloeocapsopsis dulcis AAB1 = 1H9 TaxID=1433147 RepID=A0A6N8FSS4_9CHRO|nr:protein phosphatase 2C domain-containing protein [Gloeocapsopsis dulcis]MUL36158.1 serine/threonine protein phosphatase [Gloeocapsopsis dulcis AAB1 = 1H9]WNN91367.1 protein phosphatase 2C domain-containing protein [Gloeocapsopsis dulcis]
MQNEAARLQCPNERCKAANNESDKYCQQCGTFIPKLYLWAVGSGIEEYRVGEVAAERYLLKSERLFLDTKPGLPPETQPYEITTTTKPYLRLIPYRLQVPQVYGFLLGHANSEILLLEAPIYSQATPMAGQLLPTLYDAWQKATSLRQLHWLWQIAQLWQPLSSERVVSSLLDLQLLRVEGSLVRLLQLQADQSSQPTLAELGQLWLELVDQAQPNIAEFLHQLCGSMLKGVLSTDALVTALDRGITEIGRSQARKLVVSTYTDPGPTRQRNEDACYPSSGTTITSPTPALAIVCDGIGGHEGGNVASQLAVDILQQVKQLPLDDINLDATTLSHELEHFVRVANDQISQRNDNEHRFGRQRMGTTLIMALERAHEMYITHVGDSRAYWITRTGCHQLTLDDDVASREVRLGYSLYRNALAQASSGSLVQALGMSSSAALHPTVQRFVLDENSIFLLCSDGLSDYDRVEEYWDTAILPAINGNIPEADVVARLVEISNTQNGHDNVTVVLVSCKVEYSEPAIPLSVTLVEDIAHCHERDNTAKAIAYRKEQTKVNLTSTRRLSLPIVLGAILLLMGGGLLTYFLLGLNRRNQPLSYPTMLSPIASPTEPPITPSVAASTLSVGTLVQINRQIDLEQNPNAIAASTSQSQIAQVPTNGILKVTGKKENLQQGDLLRLKFLCVTNNTADLNASPNATQLQQNTTLQTIQLGQEGWIDQTTLLPNIEKTLGQTRSNSCPISTNSTMPTP